MTEQENIIIHQLSKAQLIVLVAKLHNGQLLSQDEIKMCDACESYSKLLQN